jgi:hypothetical protein
MLRGVQNEFDRGFRSRYSLLLSDDAQNAGCDGRGGNSPALGVGAITPISDWSIDLLVRKQALFVTHLVARLGRL